MPDGLEPIHRGDFFFFGTATAEGRLFLATTNFHNSFFAAFGPCTHTQQDSDNDSRQKGEALKHWSLACACVVNKTVNSELNEKL